MSKLVKVGGFLGSLLILGLVSGCASLNGDAPFRYQPALMPVNKTIDKVAGLNLIIDKRPEGDIAYTKKIKDIPDKITSKLLEDFDKSKIFKDIHYPVRDTDDLVIDATLNRFMWKLYVKGWVYVPYLGLFLEIVGVLCGTLYGVADITLEVRDVKSGAVVGTFNETSMVKNAYTIYNTPAGDAGAELADALRDVVKKLKIAILNKIN